MMIKAVIWDFGGVLTTSPFDAFERFEAERGLPPGIIRRTNAANHWENAWAKFERAEVDLEAFDSLFAAESLPWAQRFEARTSCRYCPEICGPKWSRRCGA
jgi:putative hydrolase of the HAD superfamily